jgi:glycosyltransferase 2 family protein
MPSRSASRAAAVRDETPIFARTAETWCCTVRSEMNSRREISRLGRPSQISTRTYVLAGSVLAQLLVAAALGTSLHAVGQHASIATILVVITLASVVGGTVPVPGGLGVVEAGLIAGLTSAGIPQEQAVAAVFIQRLFTAYLPPVWGWFVLAWMRRREYV